MSDARWSDVEGDFLQAARHFRNAVALHAEGGFGEAGLAGYRAGMALMHALQSGHTSAEAGMERVLALLGEERPLGADWHRTIVDRLSRPGAPGYERPPLFAAQVSRDLQETRRFRNLAMHSYGDFDASRAGPTIEAAWRLAEHLLPSLETFRLALDPGEPAAD